MPITVPLSKPLKTHKGDVTEIVLRDIEARDLVMMKRHFINVVQTAEGQKFETDFALAQQYIEALSGIDALSLNPLPAKDFNACIDALAKLYNGDDTKN